MKKRIKIHVHRDKESNWDLAEKLGLSEEASKEFAYTGYEVALVYDVDTKTGETTLVGAGDFFLSEEKITAGEIEVSG